MFQELSDKVIKLNHLKERTLLIKRYNELGLPPSFARVEKRAIQIFMPNYGITIEDLAGNPAYEVTRK